MDLSQKMYEDAFKDFEKDCYRQNIAFLQELRKISPEEGVKIGEKNGVLSFVIPAHATGAHLLKEFIRAVTHSKFTPENALKRGEKDYLRVKVNFETSNIAITLFCQASVRQPGNAQIHKYGGYTTDHADTNLANFFAYFQRSLEHPLLPPTSKGLRLDKNWKLMVLLLFEIARRMPSRDVYHHIPIAAGIMMAMHVPGDITTGKFVDLFMGTERVRETTFRLLARTYFEAEWKRWETWMMIPMNIPVAIKQAFNERMNIYYWTPPQISTGLGFQSSTSSVTPQEMFIRFFTFVILVIIQLICDFFSQRIIQKPWGGERGFERLIHTWRPLLYSQVA